MNITQLEKVIEKLRYYEVDKEIDDLPNYLKNLTPKELENIISMDFDRKHNEFSNIPWVEIFDNNYLLSFDNFYECLNAIFNDLYSVLSEFDCRWIQNIKSSDDLCGFLMFGMTIDEDARNSDFLLTDMKLIVNKIKKLSDMFHSKPVTDSNLKYFSISKKLIRIMYQIATNVVSLEGSTHSKVMETLFDMEPNEKNLYIAECLKKVECFISANNFSYHSTGLDLIITSKTDKIAKVLTDVQLSEIAYKMEDDVLINDLGLIHAAKNDVIADCLGVVITSDVSIENPSLKRLMHGVDMKKISLSSTNVIAKCLSAVARNKSSIESGNHVKHVAIIFEASSDEKALAYTRVILNSDDADALDKIMFNARLFIDDQPNKNIKLPASVFKITQKNSS